MIRRSNPSKLRHAVLLASVVGIASGLADGAVAYTVRYQDGGPSCNGGITTLPGAPTTIEVQSTWCRVWVTGTPSEDIPRLTVIGNSQNLQFFKVAAFNSAAYFCVPTRPGAGGRHWRGLIDGTSHGVPLEAHITGDLIEFVAARNIHVLYVEGVISASVSGSGIWYCVEAGDVAQGASLTCSGTAPMKILVHGELQSSVRSVGGGIRAVDVGGSIGLPDAKVFIEAKDGIETIGASNAFAHINPDTDGDGIGILQTFDVPGIFCGSMTLTTFSDIEFGGDVLADIDILGELPEGGELVIGGALGEQGTIRVGSGAGLGGGSLGGQIVINQANVGGEWSGQVIVDGTVLDPPPYYENSAALLGGGSVGLAAFTLHGISCDPANGSTVLIGDVPLQVRLRHYGPVFWTTDPPVSIWRRPVGTDDPFVELPTEDFTYSQAPGDPNSIVTSGAQEDGFEPGYLYVFEPTSNLLCLGVGEAGTEPSVLQYQYALEILESTGDYNGDGVKDGSDFELFRNAFGYCLGDPGYFAGADLDGDACVTLVDYQEWFALFTDFSKTGACCVGDASCVDAREGACLADRGLFEGYDTSCVETVCPEGYENAPGLGSLRFFQPGGNVQVADDMVLAGASRDLVSYHLAVAGLGGTPFGATVGLYTGCPGDGGVLIPGTEVGVNDIPNDGFVYLLEIDVGPLVVVPDPVWMVASFTDDNAVWVLADRAELGQTENVLAVELPPWICGAFFGDGIYAGFWAGVDTAPGSGLDSRTGITTVNVTPDSHRRVVRGSSGTRAEVIQTEALNLDLPDGDWSRPWDASIRRLVMD